MAQITRSSDHSGADRYKYDFRKCRSVDGWAQLDTRQDASYYGNWINPITLELFSYCEGDLAHTKCDDATDFVATVRDCVGWHKEQGYFIGIDGMCDERIIGAFQAMGLADVLH
jgi:hypothetical protein